MSGKESVPCSFDEIENDSVIPVMPSNMELYYLGEKIVDRSDEIEQLLKKRKDLYFAGSLSSSRRYVDSEVIVSAPNTYIEIFCSPKEETYDIDKLQELLSNISSPIEPNEISQFSSSPEQRYPYGNFNFGKAFYDQEIGSVTTDISTDAPPFIQKLKRTIPLIGRTAVLLYPNKYLAWMLYTYQKDPENWNKNCDWYDPPKWQVKGIKNQITLYDVSVFQKGGNPFHTEDS